VGGDAVKLLLDTHVLIWLVEGLAELGVRGRRTIERAARQGGVGVSAISFWEVAMLAQRGRLTLSKPVADWRRQVLAAPGLVEVAVSGEIGIEAVTLPGQLHPDPADRILVATARALGVPFVTRDARILDYGRAGHVATVSA
jgi:PIN domain nuclease of toxin-antitoxin system